MVTNPFSTYRALFLIGFCILGIIAILAQPKDSQTHAGEDQVHQKFQGDIESLEKSAALEDILCPDEPASFIAFSE